ncbi:MAG: hypothetical protein IKC34_03730 [Clostridia bacterium]|nr:hypothetical protein [Clostridia bacterium]
MIRVKKKFNKKLLTAIVLLISFVVLLTASILMNIFLGGDESSGNKYELLEVLDGESVYGSYNVAYPYIDDAKLNYISVSDKSNSFRLARPDENGDMILYYTNAEGRLDVYYPNILGTDENIAYSSLYAIDQKDGMGMIPAISYLCSAVGFTAFQDRIKLSDDPDVRKNQLESFGLTEDKAVSVKIAYSDEESKSEKTHTITIGKQNISGAGRYFIVDNRDYVYCSATNYMEYGVQGFVYFIKPYLVTEGMSGDDSILAAYLTTDFREWKNTVHKTEGEAVAVGSQVIANAESITPLKPGGAFSSSLGDSEDGYRYSGFAKTEFNLGAYKDNPDYVRMINALTGKKIGKYYDYTDKNANLSEAIIFTLISQSKTIDFGENDAVSYEYKITAIESILTDEAEITETGVAVLGNKLIKVTYEVSCDGKKLGSYPSHAVIDLDDERIPADAKAALSSAKVGTLSTAVTFSIDYTVDNAVKFEGEYVVCDILEIYDKDGKEATQIKEDSIVVYRYYIVADGVKQDDIHVGTASLAKTEGESEETAKLREALVGKGISADVNISVMKYTEYSEIFYDFITYRISEIEYFVTSELVAAFGFVNASDRDPFYGESVYENKTEGKYSLYGINADACIEIVKSFMGITSSSSSTSSGLLGDETVAVGLTPTLMDKYGLYAYTIYIEIPRGIYPREDENYDDENALDNYDWRDTLSFYLYVSEEQYDGTRYVASDMYDIVVKMDGEMFNFLKLDFAEFWARRNLLLTDFMLIENMKLEFNMNDVYGKYNFDIRHETVYVDENGKSYVIPPDDIYTDVYKVSHIDTSQSGKCFETEFSKFLEANGLTKTSMTTLYNNVRGDGSLIMSSKDTLGSSNFKNLMHLVYGIYYTDTLTDMSEAEKAEIKSKAPLMKMSVLLETTGYYYTYEFHRIDERRIMVNLYRSDSDGNQITEGVCDMYISTFAFKKIAQGFIDILNAKDIDAEVGYPTED